MHHKVDANANQLMDQDQSCKAQVDREPQEKNITLFGYKLRYQLVSWEDREVIWIFWLQSWPQSHAHRDHTMESNSSKIMEICSEHVECKWDVHACKEKWSTLLVNYKKIYDHHKGTSTSSHWDMSGPEIAKLHLPRIVLHVNYVIIDNWFQIKHVVSSPHARDVNQPGDVVFNHTTSVSRGMESVLKKLGHLQLLLFIILLQFVILEHHF